METQKIVLKLLVCLVLLSSAVDIYAQAEPCPCCAEQYDAFDYWIGEWVVFDTAGAIIGHNNIVKELDGCALKESWVSNRYNRGSSVNYYDRNDQLWHQVWVDNSGSILNLYGTLSEGVMVLRSAEQQGTNGRFYNQISWVPQEDGSVHQIWDVMSPQGVKLSNLFTGIYKKRR